jgi:4-amino-4-deoxy-L-arabinose transferase-like glycosyltransferase
MSTGHARSVLLFAAVIYAVLAFAVSLLWFPIGDIGVESDFYAEIGPAAVHLASGDLAAAYYPFKGPLPAFSLVAVHALTSPFNLDWYRSAVLLNALCAAALLVLVFHWLDQLGGRVLAALATLIMGITAEFFLQAHKATSDLLFTLLMAGALYLLLASRLKKVDLVFGSCLAAAAFLTRYNGIILLLAVPLAWWIANPGDWSSGRRLATTGVFLSIIALVSAPWLLFFHAQTGHLLPPGNFQNIVRGIHDGAQSSAVRPAAGLDSLSALIAHEPLRLIGRVALNAVRYLWYDLTRLLGPVAGLLAALGLARFVWRHAGLRPPDRRAAAILISLLIYRLAMGLVFYLPRFSLPLLPAYSALGATAVLHPWRPGKRSLAGMRRGRTALGLAVGLLLVGNVYQIGILEGLYRSQLPIHYLDAVAPMRRLAASRPAGPTRLMARKPHLAFLAGLLYVPYPRSFAGPAELLAFARQKGVDLILVSDVERLHFPESSFLEDLDLAADVRRVLQTREVTLYTLGAGDRQTTAVSIPAVPPPTRCHVERTGPRAPAGWWNARAGCCHGAGTPRGWRC